MTKVFSGISILVGLLFKGWFRSETVLILETVMTSDITGEGVAVCRPLIEVLKGKTVVRYSLVFSGNQTQRIKMCSRKITESLLYLFRMYW